MKIGKSKTRLIVHQDTSNNIIHTKSTIYWVTKNNTDLDICHSIIHQHVAMLIKDSWENHYDVERTNLLTQSLSLKAFQK